jgi:hypothetical protein
MLLLRRRCDYNHKMVGKEKQFSGCSAFKVLHIIFLYAFAKEIIVTHLSRQTASATPHSATKMSEKTCLDPVSFGKSLHEIAEFAATYLEQKHQNKPHALRSALEAKGEVLNSAVNFLANPCKREDLVKAERSFPSGTDKINGYLFIASDNYIPKPDTSKIAKFKLAVNRWDLVLVSKEQPMPGWKVVQKVLNPDLTGLVPDTYLISTGVGLSKVKTIEKHSTVLSIHIGQLLLLNDSEEYPNEMYQTADPCTFTKLFPMAATDVSTNLDVSVVVNELRQCRKKNLQAQSYDTVVLDHAVDLWMRPEDKFVPGDRVRVFRSTEDGSFKTVARINKIGETELQHHQISRLRLAPYKSKAQDEASQNVDRAIKEAHAPPVPKRKTGNRAKKEAQAQPPTVPKRKTGVGLIKTIQDLKDKNSKNKHQQKGDAKLLAATALALVNGSLESFEKAVKAATVNASDETRDQQSQNESQLESAIRAAKFSIEDNLQDANDNLIHVKNEIETVYLKEANNDDAMIEEDFNYDKTAVRIDSTGTLSHNLEAAQALLNTARDEKNSIKAVETKLAVMRNKHEQIEREAKKEAEQKELQNEREMRLASIREEPGEGKTECEKLINKYENNSGDLDMFSEKQKVTWLSNCKDGHVGALTREKNTADTKRETELKSIRCPDKKNLFRSQLTEKDNRPIEEFCTNLIGLLRDAIDTLDSPTPKQARNNAVVAVCLPIGDKEFQVFLEARQMGEWSDEDADDYCNNCAWVSNCELQVETPAYMEIRGLGLSSEAAKMLVKLGNVTQKELDKAVNEAVNEDANEKTVRQVVNHLQDTRTIFRDVSKPAVAIASQHTRSNKKTKATTNGVFEGGDPDDPEDTFLFEPCARRHLVRLLMEDRTLSVDACMDRMCGCQFGNVAIGPCGSDDDYMRAFVRNAVNRQRLRGTLQFMHPFLSL